MLAQGLQFWRGKKVDYIDPHVQESAVLILNGQNATKNNRGTDPASLWTDVC